jgi:ABC-type Na+ efflux pump permease subunit
MGDMENESLAGDAGGVEAAAADEPIDPVKAAEGDAWLAQFRADNAAKVMRHNYEAAEDAQAEARGEAAKRDYELQKAKELAAGSAQMRTGAAEYEQKAQQDPSRHDEYEAKAEFDRHKADAADSLAAESRADAAAADEAAKRQEAEAQELYKIFQQHEGDYRTMQEQATAAQRIATNEGRLQHPGDPAPGDAPVVEPSGQGTEGEHPAQ